MAVYERIGKGYDLTRRADPYLVSRLKDHLRIRAGASYLDVACGTGNYTVALSQAGGNWHAVDQSPRMIAAARKKSEAVRWQLADVTGLPYRDRVFSGVVCTLAIHHFPSLMEPFNEINRVMTEGRFVLFTSTPEQTGRYWLAEYFPDAISQSAAQLPSLEALKETLFAAGFQSVETEDYSVREDLQDSFLYSGKHRPAIYLEETVRNGISTFAQLASEREIEEGCRKLAADIETGQIRDVVSRYEHDAGDYKFVIARK